MLNAEDWDFELGERVTVGMVQAVITGQATFAYEPDSFQVVFTNEDGLPEQRWFIGQLISKEKTQ